MHSRLKEGIDLVEQNFLSKRFSVNWMNRSLLESKVLVDFGGVLIGSI